MILNDWASLYGEACVSPDGEFTGGHDWDLMNPLYLTTAADDRLVYSTAVPATVTPGCRWSVSDRPGCATASCRTCDIQLGVWTGNGGAGMNTAEIRTTLPDPSCAPCPPDRQGELLPRLTAILANLSVLDPIDVIEPLDGLRFFRRKADCDAYVREARFGP